MLIFNENLNYQWSWSDLDSRTIFSSKQNQNSVLFSLLIWRHSKYTKNLKACFFKNYQNFARLYSGLPRFLLTRPDRALLPRFYKSSVQWEDLKRFWISNMNNKSPFVNEVFLLWKKKSWLTVLNIWLLFCLNPRGGIIDLYKIDIGIIGHQFFNGKIRNY